MELESTLAGGIQAVVEAPETEPGVVSELNAKGFKNITVQPPESQNVIGKGIYQNGRWKIVLKRALNTEDVKGIFNLRLVSSFRWLSQYGMVRITM